MRWLLNATAFAILFIQTARTDWNTGFVQLGFFAATIALCHDCSFLDSPKRVNTEGASERPIALTLGEYKAEQNYARLKK